MWKCLEKYMSRVTLFPHQLLTLKSFLNARKHRETAGFLIFSAGIRSGTLAGKG